MSKWLALALIISSIALTTGGVAYMKTRGIRNNNPGNIKKSSSQWVGLAPQQTDTTFFQFSSPEYGIRAIYKILMTYRSRGLDTVEKIISAWAPSVENPTHSYITTVARQLGTSPNTPLTLAHYPGLIKAIIKFENGSQPYSDSQIDTAMRRLV